MLPGRMLFFSRAAPKRCQMDRPRIEPGASRMLSGRDTTTPKAPDLPCLMAVIFGLPGWFSPFSCPMYASCPRAFLFFPRAPRKRYQIDGLRIEPRAHVWSGGGHTSRLSPFKRPMYGHGSCPHAFLSSCRLSFREVRPRSQGYNNSRLVMAEVEVSRECSSQGYTVFQG